MDLKERLSAVGLSYGEFAKRLNVTKSAVGNMAARGELTTEAEQLLASLEDGPANGDACGFTIPIGNLVRDDAGATRMVVRRDRLEFLNGRVSWLYFCDRVQKQQEGWKRLGGISPYPPALLTDLGEAKIAPMVKEA